MPEVMEKAEVMKKTTNSFDEMRVTMKKYLICTLLICIFITGCQSSTEYKNKQANTSMEPESKKNNENSIESPEPSSAIQILDQEYDVYQSGKEIKNEYDKNIYFSNEELLCYSEVNKERDNSEIFFLCNRKTEQKHRIIAVDHLDTCWGEMYEKDHCLYLAVGVTENNKEKSYILKIDEKTFRGELIKIKGCNTIFSSVVCTDDAIFVWFMKERENSKEYCLNLLEEGKINAIDSWIYKNKSETGQQMSTFGTNGEELFCYVEDQQGNASMDIYNKKGEKIKNISIDFSDFQIISGETDVFMNLYCFKNRIFFETLDHRILVAKYDGENIVRINEENFLASLAGVQNQEKEEIESGSGSCMGVASFPDRMILCGNLENTNELIIWEVENEKMIHISFQAGDAEILSYHMLTETEVIVRLVDDESESRREFYCELEW